MIYLLFDFITQNFTGIYLASFIFILHFLNTKEFGLSMILLYLLSNNWILLINFLLMYIIDRIVFKYVSYNFLFAISLFTFFYLVLNKIDISYFINLIFVILMYLHKYNNNGDVSV